jgi:DNA-binding FrmR family transcriptional regulator
MEQTEKTRPYLDKESQKALADRLARIEGHLHAVREMLLEHRCVDEILLQVAAVKAALNKFSAILIEQELKSCMNSCMAGDIEERIEKITKVLATLLKNL